MRPGLVTVVYCGRYFTETLWPEFDASTLQQALDAYAQRERRFGLTSAQLATRTETTNA